MVDETGERTEAWFVARGIPHFIDRYSATEDVFTRALPLLALIALFELLPALNFDWPAWLNAVAIAGSFAILLGGFAGLNLARDRRPFERPSRVGPVELAAFVVLPAVLPLVFGAQEGSALGVLATNLVLLGVIYLGTSYAVIPITRWAAGRLWVQLGSLLGLMLRALPLLLLFATFLFLTTEVWEVSAELHGPFFWIVLFLFFVTGTVFLLARVPREIGALSRFDGWEEVVSLTGATPVAGIVPTGDVPSGLGKRQWGNVGLVVIFTQGLQILLVSAMVGLFFVVFGLLAVTPTVVEAWSGGAANVLLEVVVWDRPVIVTEELLRVAGFLTAFSGLYFTVSVLTDDTYRAEFFEEVIGELRQACAVRAVYVAVERGTA